MGDNMAKGKRREVDQEVKDAMAQKGLAVLIEIAANIEKSPKELKEACKKGELKANFLKLDNEGYGIGDIWLNTAEVNVWIQEQKKRRLASLMPKVGKIKEPTARKAPAK